MAALAHPEASFNRAVIVQSFVTTPNAVLAEFEKQTGGEPWAVTHIPLEELKKREKDAWASGSPVATVFTLRRIWAEGGTLYDTTDNEAIGLAPRDMESLETAVRRAIESKGRF